MLQAFIENLVTATIGHIGMNIGYIVMLFTELGQVERRQVHRVIHYNKMKGGSGKIIKGLQAGHGYVQPPMRGHHYIKGIPSSLDRFSHPIPFSRERAKPSPGNFCLPQLQVNHAELGAGGYRHYLSDKSHIPGVANTSRVSRSGSECSDCSRNGA